MALCGQVREVRGTRAVSDAYDFYLGYGNWLADGVEST